FQVLVEKENASEEILYRIRGPLKSDDRRLIDVVKKRFLIPPSLLPYNLTAPHDPEYRTYSKGDSWNAIHAFVETLFSDEPPGFFVEAGALDGEYLSNTLWLEQSHGWTGLLVEPDGSNFQHLQNKHRKSWLSNTCLSKDIFPKEVVHVSRTLRNGDTSVGIFWNNRGSAHELDVEVLPKTSMLSLVANEAYSVTQCFPLDTLLLALNISTVDFLSLDIQGREKDVLRTVLLSNIKIRVIVVEIVEENIDHNFVDLMSRAGYVLVNRDALSLLIDHVYVRKDETILHEKLRRVAFSFKMG
ncbi:protein Star-like, partial [Palaemon carinicauda]|uniref:protein Star-like n=1 Tax=Palaemon carinicauda TaxID=392227 RepID=UPI0035B6A2AF